MQFSTFIDRGDIITALADGDGDDDPVKFVMDLDEQIADEGFTLDVMSGLAEALLKDYEATEQQYTERLMEVTFGDDTAFAAWSPKPASLIAVAKQRETMAGIIALLKDLLKDFS